MDAGPDERLTAKRSDCWHLLLLLVLTLPLKAWLLYNTEVPARDSVGYMRYALHFEQKPWAETLQSHEQHPGYSFAIWLVSMPLRAWHGQTDAEIMRIAAQTTSALAAILLLAPMFYLGKELLGARVAFWGTLLFQYLPVSGHHLADGVSEPLFLLLITTAAWQACLALNRAPSAGSGRQVAHLALCSLFGGLAFLTRPEGAFLVAATGIVLVGMQMLPRWRAGWRLFGARCLALGLPALALAGLYILATGQLTRKLSPKFIIGWETLTQASPGHGETANPIPPFGAAAQGPSARRGLFASLYAAYIPRSQDYPTRLARAARTLAMELVHGFHYVGAIAALLGLYWFGGRLARQPGFWVLVAYGTLQTATLIMLAIKLFYVSDRHVMVLVLPGCFLMAAGMLEAGHRLQRWLARPNPSAAAPASGERRAETPGRDWRASIAALPIAPLLLCVTVLICLPKTMQRVHGNRAGNHLAGLWLKERLRAGDIVVDDHCWSHFYSGQVFEEGKEPIVAPDYQPLCYVVMTRSKEREIDQRRRQEEERLRAASAHVVFHWPEGAEIGRARVVVYALPRDRQKQPWKIAAR